MSKSMDKLYNSLRALVSDSFCIRITDGLNPKVAIIPDGRETHPWTHFDGLNIEDSFNRAIDKLKHPEKDYRAKPTRFEEEGYLWKADEESIYCEEHIRLFLRHNKINNVK